MSGWNHHLQRPERLALSHCIPALVSEASPNTSHTHRSSRSRSPVALAEPVFNLISILKDRPYIQHATVAIPIPD